MDEKWTKRITNILLEKHREWYSTNFNIKWVFCKYFWESNVELCDIDLNKLRRGEYTIDDIVDKKDEALSAFWSTPLDSPEEFDDVYTDACNLLEECGCTEEEINNLRRDAEAMFDEDGVFQPDWMDKL